MRSAVSHWIKARPGSALLLVAVMSLPILSGCGILAARSDSRYTVEMTDENRFLPGTVEIPLGATVVWTNQGRFEHTATDDPALALVPGHAVLPPTAEPWHSGSLSAGQVWERTFDVPGTYVYFCQRHEADGMLGSITVTE